MRRLSVGRSLAAIAAAGFLAAAVIPSPALRPDAPRISNEQRRKRSKNKKGPAPNGFTAQTTDKDRLIADRASSFKKLRRWSRRDASMIIQPDVKALQRHGWWRRKNRLRAAA